MTSAYAMNGTEGRRAAVTAVFLSALLAVMLAAADGAGAARIKDIATFAGVRTNQLVGYGLIVGLSGTGDKSNTSQFTVQSMANMLQNMGVRIDPATLKPKNVAAVMVTAQMPASAKPGTRLDVTVSSLGDASSLFGGVLLMTPMKGIDGNVYAVAQGPLALGGFSASGEAASAQKNITTVGSIPNGAMVERGVPFVFNQQDVMTLNLQTNDFSTTMQIVNKINQAMSGSYAKALDISTIELQVPPAYRGNLVPLMASIENLDVTPDSRSKVVVDEKTGTVVLGLGVRLNRVAVAHGSLQVVIRENKDVSQPGAFSQGQTVVTPQTDIGIKEENRRLVLMEGATLQELVDGLNSIGATPRDLISILKTLKSAGALHADLEVM